MRPDPQVLREVKGQLEPRGLRVMQVPLVPLVLQDHKGMKVVKVRPEPLAPPVVQGLPVPREQQGLPDQREAPGLPGLPARLVPPTMLPSATSTSSIPAIP